MPLPNKGDLHNFINWGVLNLIKIISKIVSIIVNEIAQKLLKYNKHLMSFGSTSNVGYLESLLML